MKRIEIAAKSAARTAKKFRELQDDIEFNDAANERGCSEISCLKLWRSVLGQAFFDACRARAVERSDFSAENNAEIPIAREWLERNDTDFDLVCDLADVNSSAMRARAKLFAKNDWRPVSGISLCL